MSVQAMVELSSHYVEQGEMFTVTIKSGENITYTISMDVLLQESCRRDAFKDFTFVARKAGYPYIKTIGHAKNFSVVIAHEDRGDK